jgi:branched-chain amino acid transport system ATP-binding protein
VRPTRGSITLGDVDLGRLQSHEVVEQGVIQVPEGRRIFPEMTVVENLRMGSFVKATRKDRERNMERVFTLFPRLAERKSQLAGSMSGGEQQMLALARALMLNPRILLIDEPSVGLAPVLVSRTIDAIKQLKEHYQLTVLMAEQNFTQAIRIADRGYVIVHGKIAFEGGSADELNNNDLIREFYLGLEASN